MKSKEKKTTVEMMKWGKWGIMKKHVDGPQCLYVLKTQKQKERSKNREETNL